MYESLKNKTLFVLDMDGTIYLDDTPIEGAREFVDTAKKNGRKIIYFTNNASKSISMYYEKLDRLGFAVAPGEIVSSADVTEDYLNTNYKGKSVYLVGTPALESSFKKAGITLTDGSYADIVVVSFDTTLTYDKLDNACHLIRNGADFISTHPDFNCPVKKGFIPDSGAICALVTASTGVKPKYLGKPYVETANYLAKISKSDFKDVAVVGDRLYTDIALGRNHGITSILVLTGETKPCDVNNTNAPDFIFDRLGDIIPFVS